jgi:glyoxylase-like metal-dependent hydrolase (beta-lactamase superfamily II)
LIVPLHAGNPSPMTGWGNWTYYLPGRHPAMIDAGVGVDTHLEAIAAAAPAGPGHVLVTHAHGDHISGVVSISARWPETMFFKMPWPDRDGKFAVPWQPLRHGDVVRAGDGELQVVHTPGHSPDHLAFWDPTTRTLFSGDLVVSGTTVVIPATLQGSLSAYLQSLERILVLAPERLLPAHGSPIDNPAAIVHEYLEHRREREQQVIAGLRQGDRTVEALVARIYVGLKESLVPVARESVLAHLHKLQEDGAAWQVDAEWHLR